MAIDLAGRVAVRLGDLDGVAAVTLGGTLARREADADSDVDLGVYYHPERRLRDAAGADRGVPVGSQTGRDRQVFLGGELRPRAEPDVRRSR